MPNSADALSLQDAERSRSVDVESDLQLNTEVIGQRDHPETLARGANNGNQLRLCAALGNRCLSLRIAPQAYLAP
jgi:hypothetical protein